MEGKITYHQQVSYCGKLRCRKCREGIGHGPYWYAYQTINGQTTRTYIGKHLPAEVRAAGTTQFSDTPDNPANPTNPAQPHPASSPQTSLVLLRIFTLGQFRLERRVANRWHAVNDSDWLRSNRMRALLALLICSPGRRVSRAHAIEVLKLGKDPSTAGSRLDTTLRRLRKILHHSSTSRSSRALREAQVQDMLLRSEGDTLVLADQSIIWIDADAFESFTTRRQALSSEVTEEASSLPRSSLPAPASPLTASEAARLAELREAVALYQGDFLPEGKQLAWVTTRRRLLHHAWIALLLELSDLYIANAEMTAAIETLNLLLTHDPAHEAAIQRLIVTLAKLQRRGEAIRAYQQFADVLAREQQAVPSEETQRLVRAIREGRDLPHTLSSHTATEQEISPSEEVSPSSSPLERLAGHLQIMPVGRSNQSPLVGRDAELDTLRRMLLEIEQNAQSVEEQRQVEQQAGSIPFYTQRRPQCAVLLGEIGIGKTRLAEEISRVAQRRNFAIVWSRVSAQESTIPYRLWAEVLRRALYISSELLPASFTSSAHAVEEATGLGNGSEMSLPALLRPLSMILPEISEILPQAKALPASQFAAEPGQEQLRLWQAAHTLLTLLSTNVPLLLVLDDIQWADSNSCDLFGHLCRHLSGYPILIVATCRANEFSANQRLHTLIAHMQREHSVMTLNIAPLSTEQIGTLVTGVSPLPAATVQYIQSQAAGIPLFAEELARSHAGATPPALPESVAAALEQRLRKLSQDCHELLKNAAVLGSSFELPLIETMIEGSDQPGEEETLVLLEEALQSGVLTEEGMGNHITYHFWHPLLVDHLYQSISATRRARLHLRAAEALIQLYRDNEETVAATITHHLVQADAEPLRIAAYAELAGQQAYALLAYKEATQHYALAVAKLDQAALSSGTASGEQPPQETLTHLIFLLERLAECNMICGNYQEARKLYERILSLRHQVSLPDALLEAQIQALLWSEIGWTWRYETDSTRAWHCCTEGERVLRKAGVAGGPAWARMYHLRSSLYLQEGHYDAARQAASEELLLLEQQQRMPVGQETSTLLTTFDNRSTTRIQRILTGDPVDLGRAYRRLGDIACTVGLRSEGLAHLHTALSIYERYNYKREIAHVSCNLSYNYFKKGEHGLAREILQRAFNLAESMHDDPLLSVVYSDLAAFAAAAGAHEEAERWYKRALELAEHTNDREYLSRWNAALALSLEQQDKLKEASDCAVYALKIGRATHKNPCIGEALVALGNLRLLQANEVVPLPTKRPRMRSHLLKQARKLLTRAIALNGVEAETKTRAQILLSRVSLASTELQQARTEAAQALAMARDYELAQEEALALELQQQLAIQ